MILVVVVANIDYNTNKLNLGCGEFKKPGYLNVDYGSVSAPDVVHNLETVPYPFENNSPSTIIIDLNLVFHEKEFDIKCTYYSMLTKSPKSGSPLAFLCSLCQCSILLFRISF